MLGWGAGSPDESWHFGQFRGLVAKCAEATEEADVVAVARFLDFHRQTPVRLPVDVTDAMLPGDMVTFRVDNSRRPVDLQKVRSFWVGNIICPFER